MKSIAIWTILLLFNFSSLSQRINSESSFKQDDYLQKSKNRKTIGTVLLVGGAGLILGSFVIPQGKVVQEAGCPLWICSEKYKNDGLKSAFVIAGGLSALSSIPFFISAKKNRRKAKSVSFKMERATQLYNQTFVFTYFPVVRIKVVL